MDAGGIIQSASESVEQIFGWTPTELFARNVKMLIPEPRRSALDRYLDRYRHADRPAALEKTGQFSALRKDGKRIRIELSMSRADLPAHSSPFFIGIVRDVTQKIDVGRDANEERVRLQNLITEQTRALATANLRLHLADRMSSLGTLAAGVGHDMSNVLLPVRARLNAIEHAGITPRGLGHLRAVRRSITYLQHLSDGLHYLALDPDGPGAAPDSEGPTDLKEWWTQVGPLLRRAVPKHVKVVAALGPRLSKVAIAPHWLTQAMLNLIVNAGEALAKKRRGARVQVSALIDESGQSVRIRVADNGMGMPAAIMHRAFDMFFTTKPRGMGTGLGLPLVRKVAIRAGGSVELESEPGRGTVVTLLLPVAADVRRPKAGNGDRPKTAVVSIDDHRTVALLTQILVSAGYRLSVGRGAGPGSADLWITRASVRAFTRASRWRRGHPKRRLVLLGMPPKGQAARWTRLEASVIDPPDDFEAMRHVIGGGVFGRQAGEQPGGAE